MNDEYKAHKGCLVWLAMWLTGAALSAMIFRIVWRLTG